MAELEADPATDPLVLATVRVEMGHNLEFVGELESGERLIRQGMAELEAKLPPNDTRVLSAYGALGSLLVEMRRPQDGLPYLEENLRRRMALNPRDPSVPRARISLGRALTELGRFDEARPHLEQAVADFRAIGPFPQGRAMIALVALGNLQMKQREWSAAEASLREGLRITDAINGPRGANALEVRYLLAQSIAGQARWPEVVAVLSECEPLISWTLPADAEWGVAYAEALLRTGNAAQASEILDRAAPLIAAKPAQLAETAAKASALRAELVR